MQKVGYNLARTPMHRGSQETYQVAVMMGNISLLHIHTPVPHGYPHSTDIISASPIYSQMAHCLRKERALLPHDKPAHITATPNLALVWLPMNLSVTKPSRRPLKK